MLNFNHDDDDHDGKLNMKATMMTQLNVKDDDDNVDDSDKFDNDNHIDDKVEG